MALRPAWHLFLVRCFCFAEEAPEAKEAKPGLRLAEYPRGPWFSTGGLRAAAAASCGIGNVLGSQILRLHRRPTESAFRGWSPAVCAVIALQLILVRGKVCDLLG